ncbi:chymotrypsin family serine protease [Natronorubrum daqingense]|uniref:Uncharacterized protein n=1 Tax=Natronorubrum daqingense TaxID=588898 RepID=A0A1N6YVA5_9EURY|nr:hypothetical protein [Natronorubrum daqingense]APX95557.1 hypothetical protein BB347_02415 [Natronorubrum daqingense]SIR18321.1 hypothetical protein SAMN05421809_0565 [Natronorubrum daqingense]
MPSSQDYEYLLECKNVIGVDYDAEGDRVTVFVTQKESDECLSDEDHVEKRIAAAGDDVSLDVVDAGYDEERAGFDALSTLEPVPEAASGRTDRHRPIPAGVSEINENSTAGTGGPYPARVTDVGAGDAVWDGDVDSGDIVRLSNNHTYARSNAADLGEVILQPSPEDGGDADDAVGELVGYVPIEEGVRVDVAARSVDPEQESTAYYELEESWPTAVRREGYGDLQGETVTKTGRTTGVTSATIEATSASVRVDFGEDHGPVLLREQLVTGPMSEGGDSGSPVFLEDGTLVGLLFGGSVEQTICNRIATVETELGVEILTAEPDGEDGRTGREDVPVQTTAFDHTVSVDLETPSVSLEAIRFEDRIRPGESVDVAITIDAAPGTYWLAIDDERTTVSVDVDENEESRANATGTVPVSLPDELEDRITFRIRGGPIGTLA